MDIREVAKRAGVSMATVSRAFNGSDEVSPITRQRVLEVADSLGYRPNAAARALVRRRSDTVGLLWDTSPITQGRSQPFLQDVLVGIKMALDEAGLNLTLLSTRDERADAFSRMAREHSLDGMILMGVDARHAAIAALIETGVPSVGFDIRIEGPAATWVASENRASAASAVDHLVGLGHRRIATIAGPSNMLAGADRLEGFLARATELGIAVPGAYLERGDFFHASGLEAMKRLLALEEPPTAVFAASDEMAIGALRAALDAGLSVPGDVSVLGIDDLESAALVRPSLTTLAQDHLALGRTIVDRLTALVERRRADPDAPPLEPTLLPTRLLVRESTGPAPE